jgi:hypothetical protein
MTFVNCGGVTTGADPLGVPYELHIEDMASHGCWQLEVISDEKGCGFIGA